LVAGDVKLETQLTTGLGGLKLLGVLADGSVYVVREDVVAQQPVKTVHYVSADGLQLGVARVPIAEAYYYVMRNLAVGPDGYVYSLLPRPDAVYIVTSVRIYTRSSGALRSRLVLTANKPPKSPNG
jgi:hypothetical protein